MARSRINKSRYRLKKKRLSKRKKSILKGGDIIRYDDGSVYDGEIKDGKKHGRGKMNYITGEIYEGDWKDDARSGSGNLTWVNGNIYTGEWNDDKWNGNGVFSEKNGSIYDGQWKDNRREGIGKQIYFNGIIYEGEFKDDKKNGRGKFTWPDGEVYEGEFNDDNFNGIGKYTYSNGSIYEGEWKDDKKHGQGVRYYTHECGFMEGEYINDLEEGRHTHFACDGKMIKYYYYNHGKIFTFENDIVDKYIISEQIGDTSNRYITIFINLHGSDVINSKCRLAHNKHVRCISPVKCGQIFISDPDSIIDAFLIAYNISHLQHNSNASTYQKMMKTIEVYNQSNHTFYDLEDGAFSKPLIDHYYLAYPIDDVFKQICVVDTNHLIDIFRDSYGLFSQKNTVLKTFEDIDQYNILSKLIPLLNINSQQFLRSNLINVLLDLGYDTINIIDFSCRVFDTDNLTDLYTSLSRKDFVCEYIENPDEITQQGDVINSRRF